MCCYHHNNSSKVNSEQLGEQSLKQAVLKIQNTQFLQATGLCVALFLAKEVNLGGKVYYMYRMQAMRGCPE